MSEQNQEGLRESESSGTDSAKVVEEQTDLPRTKEDLELVRQQAARETAAQFMGALGEKNRQLEELTSRLQNQPQVAERAPSSFIEEVSGSQFLEKPMEHVGKAVEVIVDKLLEKQLAPMREMMTEYTSSRARESAIQQLSADPLNAAIMRNYPNEIQSILSGVRNPQASDIEAAITMIPGLIARGRVPNRLQEFNALPTGQLKGGNVGTGNIAPSSPSAPRREAAKVEIELSDTEENIRKRLGYTKERYIELRDNDDQSKWATPAKKETK